MIARLLRQTQLKARHRLVAAARRCCLIARAPP
jgi:hypothetical protein